MMNEEKLYEHKIKAQKEAKDCILNFLKDYKLDSINDLKFFSFMDVWKNSRYGNGKAESDGDCTKIIYAIDCLLYCDLPNFSIPYFPMGKTEYNYSGETINTFNTLFAKNSDKQSKIRALFSPEDWKKIKDDSQEHNPLAKDFYHVYQRLGNFMIYPSKTISFRKSLNTYKGKNEIILDYSDIFFNQLKQCLDHKNKHDEHLYTLNKIIKANDFYFTENKKIDDFYKDFHLQGYKNYKLQGEHYCHWHSKLFESEEIQYSFISFALNYISKATELINNRSNTIVEILKEKYPELK